MSIMRFGVHQPLEEEANRILRTALNDLHRPSQKADILTSWKEGERRRHEMYVPDGFPDAAVRRGIFTRRANPARPELNSRDTNRGGYRAPNRDPSGSLSSFVATHPLEQVWDSSE